MAVGAVVYGVRDVEKLLRLSRSTIRALIAAGFVVPARGHRGAWQFSFQDLIVLRTAQALGEANVPRRRITRSVRELRRHLPDAMPLSGLRIGAVGDRVVVSEGGARWQAESGQYLLEFGGDPGDGSLSVFARTSAALPTGDAEDWFARALALEAHDANAAEAAYERAIDANETNLDAYVNLGRLLHEAKQLAKAETVYRKALRHCGADAILLYNLAVLLDDMGRAPDALTVYQAALRADPEFADCHYNLALLCERLAKPKEAIRHMARYRLLSGRRPK